MIEGMKTEETALLKQAFVCFDEAAGNLERSYRMLTARVQELTVELEKSNRALQQTLRDNKRLEEQVQRQQRLAAMGEMAARLAHELRSPLGSIELFGSLLRQELAGEPGRRVLAEHICTAVRATDHLIGNTLSFVSPRRPKREPVSLTAVVKDAVLLATPLIDMHRVLVEIEHAADQVMVRGDEGMLRQVALNIVLNAVQAMPEGGSLRIAVKGAGGEAVRLSFADTGKGIAPADRPRLFDPFFTTRPGGTGLGLAIAHNIVVAHEGWIEVDSEAGKGSTFTVVLPQEKGAKEIYATGPAA